MQLGNAMAERLPGAWVVLGRPLACNLRLRWRWAARTCEAILSRHLKENMNNPNPYDPPRTALVDAASPTPNPSKYPLVGLTAIQMLATLLFAPTYFELTKTGAASLLALLFCVVGSICLYVAAILQFSKRPRGKTLFLAAAVLLGVSVHSWGWVYLWAFVALFGALIGAFGWWVVRERTNANAKPLHADA